MKNFVKFLLYLGCMFATCGDASAKAIPRQKQVLFVCTGNYYRSRFAEALFNEKARAAHLDWQATSRGLNLVPWQIGISHYAKEELMKRGVPNDLWSGTPKKLTKADLAHSDCVILMDEAEHRATFEKKFPQSSGQNIKFWHIPDSGQLKPAQACKRMSDQIDQLLQTFAREPSPNR